MAKVSTVELAVVTAARLYIVRPST